MLHSWTMLFLTVPLAAGREGDSCGPQGSCLLCHGPTARYFNGTCFSILLQKMDPVFNTWHTEYKLKSVDLLLLLNSKLLILQLQLIPNIRVGEACYHTEEIGVDCDKTTHGHPCCVIR